MKQLAVAKKGLYDGRATVEQAPESQIAQEYMAIAKMLIDGKERREELYHGNLQEGYRAEHEAEI